MGKEIKKVLFCGLGSIGQRHLQNLKKLRPDIEVHAFRQRKEEVIIRNLDITQTEISLSDYYEITSIYYDLEQALNENKYDLVFICNPSSKHIETALKVAEYGYNIFIEKPLSHNLNGIDRLNKLYKLNDSMIIVGFQMRFHPCLLTLENMLDNGKLGKLLSVSIHHGSYMPDWHKWEDYRRIYCSRKDLGGGVVLSQIHELDYLLWLFGDIKWLSSKGGHYSNLEINVEDTVDALLVNEKDISITLHLDFLQKPTQRFCRVITDKDTIFVDLVGNKIEINGNKFYQVDIDWNYLFVEEMKSLLCKIEKRYKDENLAVFDDGVKSLQLAMEIKIGCIK